MEPKQMKASRTVRILSIVGTHDLLQEIAEIEETCPTFSLTDYKGYCYGRAVWLPKGVKFVLEVTEVNLLVHLNPMNWDNKSVQWIESCFQDGDDYGLIGSWCFERTLPSGLKVQVLVISSAFKKS